MQEKVKKYICFFKAVPRCFHCRVVSVSSKNLEIERRKFLRHRVDLEEVFMNKLDLSSRSADMFCKLTGRTVLKNPTFYEEHIHNKSKIG